MYAPWVNLCCAKVSKLVHWALDTFDDADLAFAVFLYLSSLELLRSRSSLCPRADQTVAFALRNRATYESGGGLDADVGWTCKAGFETRYCECPAEAIRLMELFDVDVDGVCLRCPVVISGPD